jgi:hypothetical protein
VKHFKGYSSIYQVKDGDGRILLPSEIVDRKIAVPGSGESGWGLGPNEIPLGPNLQLDNFRQYMAYAMTFRAPVGNYVIQRFGVGTGTLPPTTADVQLQNQVPLIGADQPTLGTKLIDYVTYPSPFVSIIYFTLGITDANGYNITEVGLYSGDNTILVRWVLPAGINSSGQVAVTLAHRLVW